MTDAQLRYGVAARLLGRVAEIGLGIYAGSISEYGCYLLGATHGAVVAYTVEYCLISAGSCRCVDAFGHVKRQMGHIVIDAYGECLFGRRPGHFVKYDFYHRGVKLFARQAVASADDFWLHSLRGISVEGRLHVLA